jgi:hypothetical protein
MFCFDVEPFVRFVQLLEESTCLKLCMMGRNVLHAGRFTVFLNISAPLLTRENFIFQMSEATLSSYAAHCPLSEYARRFGNSRLCVASFHFPDNYCFENALKKKICNPIYLYRSV